MPPLRLASVHSFLVPPGREGATVKGGGTPYLDNAGPGPRVMAADTLEGNTLVNPAGERLGDIEHIMLDVPSGRIAYAVLSFGGFLSVGAKLFAIPWHALILDADNKCFVRSVAPCRPQSLLRGLCASCPCLSGRSISVRQRLRLI